MNILGRINSGQVDITVDVWHSGEYDKNPISKTEARAEIIRVLNIGAETEKAIKHCLLNTDDACPCCVDKICDEVSKIVGEATVKND